MAAVTTTPSRLCCDFEGGVSFARAGVPVVWDSIHNSALNRYKSGSFVPCCDGVGRVRAVLQTLRPWHQLSL